MTFTPDAIAKLRELNISALRLSIIGGGCSGYQYAMEDKNVEARPTDKVFTLVTPWERAGDPGLTVYVDHISYMYLKGTRLHFKDALFQSGFERRHTDADRRQVYTRWFSI